MGLPTEKRTLTLRLPLDLLDALEEEAIAEGRGRTHGRVYSPSATVERILRLYFEGKLQKNIRNGK